MGSQFVDWNLLKTLSVKKTQVPCKKQKIIAKYSSESRLFVYWNRNILSYALYVWENNSIHPLETSKPCLPINTPE